MVNYNYDNATYYDEAGLDKEDVFEALFGDNPAPSIEEEFGALEGEVDMPDEVTITEVRAVKQDDDLVDLIASVKELSVGTQTSRGRHPRLVWRGDEYSHYRVGVEGMK